LRDDVGRVSDPNAPNSGNSRDVLSSLPSTRPQRRSSKRDASPRAKPRGKAAGGTGATKRPAGSSRRSAASTPRPAASTSGARASTSRKRSARGPAKTVAAQGYHPVSDSRPVEPPTGAEILASAVQAAGEVAQIGLTLGERLLRAAASRLPKP
jgi:hypothetical protein